MTFENAGSTIMSVLFGIADQNDQARKVYLERFAHQYTRPLVDFLCKAKMQSEEDAVDLVQSFWVAKLLQPTAKANIVAKYLEAKERAASREFPSFRRYLLRAVSNYLLDDLRRKRRLNTVSLEQLEGFEAVSGRDGDTFDEVWANRLLRTVVSNVREECFQNNQVEMWRLFLHQLILPRLMNSSPPGYAELAMEMGFRDARSAANAVRTVIRKFQNHMKHCIGDYLPLNSVADSDAGVSQEFDEIMTVLSKPGALDIGMFDDLLQELPEMKKLSIPQEVGHFSVIFETQEPFLSSPEITLYASEADIEFRWGQLRESSIATWLKSQGGKLEPPSDVTFDALARSEYLSEDAIVAIRNVAKRAAREPEDEPVVLYGLIYLLAIAVGYEHHHRIFSSDTSEKIKLRMKQLLDLPWLDKSSKQTLQTFVDAKFAD